MICLSFTQSYKVQNILLFGHIFHFCIFTLNVVFLLVLYYIAEFLFVSVRFSVSVFLFYLSTCKLVCLYLFLCVNRYAPMDFLSSFKFVLVRLRILSVFLYDNSNVHLSNLCAPSVYMHTLGAFERYRYLIPSC